MRTADPDLPLLIARAALLEPYRQVPCLPTRAFSTWLAQRGIRLRPEALCHLWEIGILHPVAVFETALSDDVASDRFLPVELGLSAPSYVDLGVEVAADTNLANRGVPRESRDSLLWHPFQLWTLHRVDSIMNPTTVGTQQFLSGADFCKQLIDEFQPRARKRLIEFGNSEESDIFLRVLALMLLAEPIVHVDLNPVVEWNPARGESFEGYFEWAAGQDGNSMTERVGLPVDAVAAWHSTIALAGERDDPVERLRILLRHVEREKRQLMSGTAQRADGLYESAEILRRYLERFHDADLLEEDDVRYGPKSRVIKERLYGSPRAGERDRMVLRRIVRDFGLDPQARTTWFIEGKTEFGFVDEYSTLSGIDFLQAGIELLDLNGIGGLSDARMRELLERFRREEVFPYVSVDREKVTKHLSQLRRFREDGLLPAGYLVWETDFEEANFSIEELAEIVRRIAISDGYEVDITAERIRQHCADERVPVGKAIEGICREEKLYLQKNADWGRELARWAFANPCPEHLRDESGARPIVGLIAYLLRGQRSNYRETVASSVVDMDGRLMPRPAGEGDE